VIPHREVGDQSLIVKNPDGTLLLSKCRRGNFKKKNVEYRRDPQFDINGDAGEQQFCFPQYNTAIP
jgi:hypothetical protein